MSRLLSWFFEFETTLIVLEFNHQILLSLLAIAQSSGPMILKPMAQIKITCNWTGSRNQINVTFRVARLELVYTQSHTDNTSV